MLRSQQILHTPTGRTDSATARVQGMLVFSVGGMRLAARAEEVSGVVPWPPAFAVPSQTLYVRSVIRHEQDYVPAFDLAGKLKRAVTITSPLGLIVKHEDGPLAICIDDEVPLLRLIDASTLRLATGDDPDVIGTCTAAGEPIPVVSLAKLGKADRRVL